MSERWGVLCKTCDEFVDLGEQDKENFTVVYDPALNNDPVACPCGGSYVYGTRDVSDEDGAALNHWAE